MSIITELMDGEIKDINLCAALYVLMKKAPPHQRGAMLKEIVENYKKSSKDDVRTIPVQFNDNKRKEYALIYQDVVDQYLEDLIFLRKGEEEFYESLANYIMTDPSLHSDSSRAYALYDICINEKLPYVVINWNGETQMDADTYRSCIDILRKNGTANRIHYIIQITKSRTQEASLLLTELNSYEDPAMKMVVLSYILWETAVRKNRR